MSIDAPNHRYFRAKEGRWKGKFKFKITDPHKLSASSMSWFDKWSLSSLAFFSRFLAASTLSTTVDYSSGSTQAEAIHTTRISIFGVTLFRSTETIFLGANGSDLRMIGSQSFFPFLWKSEEWTAHGSVSTDSDEAIYQMPWFGLTMEQRTRMTTEGLEIIQTTPFSCANILLRWQGPLNA